MSQFTFQVPDKLRSLLYKEILIQFGKDLNYLLSTFDFTKNSKGLILQQIVEYVAIIFDEIILPHFVYEIKCVDLVGLSSEERYQSFFINEGELSERVDNFLEKYQHISFYLSKIKDQTFSLISDLLDRFYLDKDFLVNELLIGDHITDICFSGSDRHNGGKQVVIIHTNRQSVVYKPRGINNDSLVKDFLDILQNVDLILPKTLDRGEYSWQEYLPFKPCSCIDEIELFYNNAGSLLNQQKTPPF